MDSDIVIKESAVKDGYILLEIESFGVNIQGKQDGQQRTGWMTLKPPANHSIVLAVPRWAGAGPSPENAIDYSVISDLLRQARMQAEDALFDMLEDTNEEWK